MKKGLAIFLVVGVLLLALFLTVTLPFQGHVIFEVQEEGFEASSFEKELGLDIEREEERGEQGVLLYEEIVGSYYSPASEADDTTVLDSVALIIDNVLFDNVLFDTPLEREPRIEFLSPTPLIGFEDPVVIVGENFDSSSKILLGDVAVAADLVEYVSENELQFVLSEYFTDGVYTVRVENQNGMRSNEVNLEVRRIGKSATSAHITRGCGNIFFNDVDCDGYAPAGFALTDSVPDLVPPIGTYDITHVPLGNDANDWDPTLTDHASAQARYGNLDSVIDYANYIRDLKCLNFEGDELNRCYTHQFNNFYFVSTTGSDTTGEVNNPAKEFRTFGGVRERLAPGDIVVYRAGSYNHGLNTFLANHRRLEGTKEQPILFITDPGARVRLGKSNAAGNGLIQLNGGKHLIYDGFELNGKDFPDHQWRHSGVYLEAPNEGIILRNIESTRQLWGLISGAPSTQKDILIDNFVAHDTQTGRGRGPEHGIYINPPSSGETHTIVVQDTRSYRNHRHAFHIRGPINLNFTRNIASLNAMRGIEFKNPVTDTIISNSLFINNNRGPLLFWEERPGEGKVDRVKIVNNLFYGGGITNHMGLDCWNGPGCTMDHPSDHPSIGFVRSYSASLPSSTGIEIANNIIQTKNGAAIDLNNLRDFTDTKMNRNIISSFRSNSGNPSQDLAGITSKCFTPPTDNTHDASAPASILCGSARPTNYYWSVASMEHANRPGVQGNQLIKRDIHSHFENVDYLYSIDPGLFDFRYKQTNPIIDFSDPNSMTKVDLFGYTRQVFEGAGPDGGPYELWSSFSGPSATGGPFSFNVKPEQSFFRVGAGGRVDMPVTVNWHNGEPAEVQLSASGISGITFSPSSCTPTKWGECQVTMSFTAPSTQGFYPIDIEGTSTATPPTTHMARLDLQVANPFDYTFAMQPDTATIIKGKSTTSVVDLDITLGAVQPITVDVERPLPQGVTVSFPSGNTCSARSCDLQAVITTALDTPGSSIVKFKTTGGFLTRDIDFRLFAVPGKLPKPSFVAIGTTFFGPDASYTRRIGATDYNTRTNTQTIMANLLGLVDLNSNHPVFLAGDMVDQRIRDVIGECPSYNTARSLFVDSFQANNQYFFHAALGNNDDEGVYCNNRNCASQPCGIHHCYFSNPLCKSFGSDGYRYHAGNHGGAEVFILDTRRPFSSLGNLGGNQRAWLDGELQKINPATQKVVFLVGSHKIFCGRTGEPPYANGCVVSPDADGMRALLERHAKRGLHFVQIYGTDRTTNFYETDLNGEKVYTVGLDSTSVPNGHTNLGVGLMYVLNQEAVDIQFLRWPTVNGAISGVPKTNEAYSIRWGTSNTPIISNPRPQGTISVPGNRQVVMQIDTHVDATCRYSLTPRVDYDSMTSTFSTTGTRIHDQTITVDYGQTYTHYIRCRSTTGEKNLQDFVHQFSTASQAGPPVISNPRPQGSIPFTPTPRMSVDTDKDANCKYDWVPDTAYDSMRGPFTTTGGRSHETTLTGQTPGVKTLYVRCDDKNGNKNTADFVVQFTMIGPPNLNNPTPGKGSRFSLNAKDRMITLGISTDANAHCRYATRAGVDYDDTTNNAPFATTGSRAHTQRILVESDTNYNYYVRCKTIGGTKNTADFVIDFSVNKAAINRGNYFNGPFTTNFGDPTFNSKAIPQLILQRIEGAMIQFLEAISIKRDVDLVSNIRLENRSVFLDSNELPELNTRPTGPWKANIGFINSGIASSTPILKRDGQVCLPPICAWMGKIPIGNMLLDVFAVSGFSNYTLHENCTDMDNDNYNATGGVCGPIDCNDNNPAIHPGATDVCGNNIDDDCDIAIDEGCSCTPGTNRTCGPPQAGIGICKSGTQQCTTGNWSNTCNGAILPRTEICGNNLDDDCDNQTDEGCSACVDNDKDTYNITLTSNSTCGKLDCDDSNANIHPGAKEICKNGIDDNCNGQVDEGCGGPSSGGGGGGGGGGGPRGPPQNNGTNDTVSGDKLVGIDLDEKNSYKIELSNTGVIKITYEKTVYALHLSINSGKLTIRTNPGQKIYAVEQGQKIKIDFDLDEKEDIQLQFVSTEKERVKLTIERYKKTATKEPDKPITTEKPKPTTQERALTFIFFFFFWIIIISAIGFTMYYLFFIKNYLSGYRRKILWKLRRKH